MYFEALEEYGKLILLAEKYLDDNFSDMAELRKSEAAMIRNLRSEYRRLQVMRIFKTDNNHETLKLIRFFFLRERREDVNFKDYNGYLKEFMKKNRTKMVRPWRPRNGIDFDEVVEEMTSRITPPWEAPHPVLNGWIPERIKEAASVIPPDILQKGGMGKIFRVISGVFLYTLTDLDDETPLEEAKRRVDIALKCGYYFGLLHPLVDDILDSANHLTASDKMEVLRLMDHWIGGDFEVHSRLEGQRTMDTLKRTFQELFDLFPAGMRKELVMLSYFLHFSQAQDMQKLPGGDYSLNGIYVPVLLKAACTRLISCWFSGTRLSPELTNEILETGLVFQMMDDFRDMVEDHQENNFTPFTHYHHCKNSKPVNPWLIYLRAVELFIRMSPNKPVSRKALLRRFVISLRNFLPDQNPELGMQYLENLFSGYPASFAIVEKILKIPVKIADPDKSLFEPVDRFFKDMKN